MEILEDGVICRLKDRSFCLNIFAIVPDGDS